MLILFDRKCRDRHCGVTLNKPATLYDTSYDTHSGVLHVSIHMVYSRSKLDPSATSLLNFSHLRSC